MKLVDKYISEDLADTLRSTFSWLNSIGSFFTKSEEERQVIEQKPLAGDENYAVDVIALVPLDEVKDRCTDLIS